MEQTHPIFAVYVLFHSAIGFALCRSIYKKQDKRKGLLVFTFLFWPVLVFVAVVQLILERRARKRAERARKQIWYKS